MDKIPKIPSDKISIVFYCVNNISSTKLVTKQFLVDTLRACLETLPVAGSDAWDQQKRNFVTDANKSPTNFPLKVMLLKRSLTYFVNMFL